MKIIKTIEDSFVRSDLALTIDHVVIDHVDDYNSYVIVVQVVVNNISLCFN